MKCEFCLGNLSLEDANCPHCGKPNKHAQKHVKDMKNYAGRYDKTEQEVYATARRYSDTVVRIVVVAVLVVVLVLALIVRGNVYEIQNALTESSNHSNRTQHIQKFEEYLAAEDFLGFSYYCDMHEISSHDEGFEEYRPIIQAAEYYRSVYMQLMEVTSDLTQNPEEPLKLDFLGGSLQSFYEIINKDSYYEVSEEGVKRAQVSFAVMERDVEALLMAYANIPEDKLEELADMSEAQRIVLIEECMEGDR